MTTKYSVGDKIHVEFHITRVSKGGIITATLGVHGFTDNHFEVGSTWEKSIVKHIPTPYEWKAGDQYYLDGVDLLMTIIFIDEKSVLREYNGIHGIRRDIFKREEWDAQPKQRVIRQ